MSNDQELKDILLTVNKSIKSDLPNYIQELAGRVIIAGTIPLLVLRKLITNPSFYFLKDIYFQAPLYIKGKVFADLTIEELEAQLQSANINY